MGASLQNSLGQAGRVPAALPAFAPVLLAPSCPAPQGSLTRPFLRPQSLDSGSVSPTA